MVGRTAKHNWKKLFLEYCQGRFKNITEFANKKGLHPVAVQREFRKLKNGVDDRQNKTEKQNETKQNPGEKTKTKQNPHPWRNLKAQFLDWPEEKLKAYLVQIKSRLAELDAMLCLYNG